MRRRDSSGFRWPSISEMSPPEQNARPAPVISTTRTAESAPASTIASASSALSFRLRALRLSGRFRVRTRTPSSSSTSSSSNSSANVGVTPEAPLAIVGLEVEDVRERARAGALFPDGANALAGSECLVGGLHIHPAEQVDQPRSRSVEDDLCIDVRRLPHLALECEAD